MNTPLPQLERLFVTDAGLETDLIYNRGVDLTCFASIMLLHRKKRVKSWTNTFAPIWSSHAGCAWAVSWRAPAGGRALIGLQSCASRVRS
jgi:hypothetical protein